MTVRDFIDIFVSSTNFMIKSKSNKFKQEYLEFNATEFSNNILDYFDEKVVQVQTIIDDDYDNVVLLWIN